MTGEAGPSDLPGQSRVPFSCCLEEHVRYSKPGEEWEDTCHIPLFPPTSWTRKQVRASDLDMGKGPADRLTGRNGTL